MVSKLVLVAIHTGKRTNYGDIELFATAIYKKCPKEQTKDLWRGENADP